MTTPELGGFVLDAGALVALADGPNIYAATFVRQTALRGLTLLVPAAALSEAWQTITAAGDATERMNVFLAGPTVLVAPLTAEDARAAGDLTRGRRVVPDVAAAQVATICRQRGWPALAAAPDRITAIDPTVRVAKLPGV